MEEGPRGLPKSRDSRFSAAPAACAVYVLELAGGKYYVGKTTRASVEERFAEHLRGQGSAWTKLHRPLRIIAQVPDADEFEEHNTTIAAMKECGLANVRGGIYSRVELPPSDVEAITRQIRGCSDKCLECGRSGHFAAQCSQADTLPRGANEQSDAECERCGRVGHWEQSCYARTHVNGVNWCLRCGREGHEEDECYAKTRVHTSSVLYAQAAAPAVAPDWCLRCGRESHLKDTCYARTHVNGSNWCLRCGREGHTEGSCYARTDAEGYYLDY